jgi:SAM-dependent methyltransferase
MAEANREGDREKAFGDDYRQTPVDKLGIWLSARQIRRSAGSFAGKDIADIGCGFHAGFVRSVLADVASATLVDIKLADDLKADPKVRFVEGVLPDALVDLKDASIDVIICNNVLEHLWDPRAALRHMRRILRPGGVASLNVPSWRGKFFLETAAFRLNVTSAAEIDDHKRYYAPQEFWTLLVESGFRPSEITRCISHKFGLNTYAECKLR